MYQDIDGLISLSAYSNWADVFCDNMVELGVPKFIAELEKPFVWIYLYFNYGNNPFERLYNRIKESKEGRVII